MAELWGSELWLNRAVVDGTAVVGGTDSDRRGEASPSSGGDEATEGVDSVVVVVVRGTDRDRREEVSPSRGGDAEAGGVDSVVVAVVVVAGLWPFLPNFGPEWPGRQLPPRRLGCISLQGINDSDKGGVPRREGKCV